MWMDQRSPTSLANQKKTCLNHDVTKRFLELLNIVWFETVAIEDHSSKHRNFESVGFQHFKKLSHFAWFEDTPPVLKNSQNMVKQVPFSLHEKC